MDFFVELEITVKHSIKISNEDIEILKKEFDNDPDIDYEKIAAKKKVLAIFGNLDDIEINFSNVTKM